MTRALTLGLLLAVIAALALRCPQLAVRPMHNDEGLNAIKLRTLWEKGSYQYDPQEFHGPTLPYITLAWVKLTGVADFAQLNEIQLRAVTVIFGLGLILLLPLVADGLGPRATICTAFLTAVSPAMVFYSRYYIHEMLLVFFAFLALAAGWRYTRSRKIGWALLAGAAMGLMQATKETFVLTLAAAAAALALTALWNRASESNLDKFQYNVKHIIAALIAWFVVVIVLFSSFFTNAQGPLDSVRTYLPWLHRVGGASPHIHPWGFYLERVVFFHPGKGPIWSEGLILGLAIVGAVAAFLRRGIAEGRAGFVRFLAFYTFILTVIYSGIDYKTPWCLLNFWHGMILLAGVGCLALIHWLRALSLKFAMSFGLLAGAAQLACQAWQAGVTYASAPANPYVYAQTAPDILNLMERVNGVARMNTQKDQMVIKVMAPESEYGPLPWYLRGFAHVGFWGELAPDPYASVLIVSTKFGATLDAKGTHVMTGIFELRPQVFFELYVESNLWNSYVSVPKARTQP